MGRYAELCLFSDRTDDDALRGIIALDRDFFPETNREVRERAHYMKRNAFPLAVELVFALLNQTFICICAKYLSHRSHET